MAFCSVATKHLSRQFSLSVTARMTLSSEGLFFLCPTRVSANVNTDAKGRRHRVLFHPSFKAAKVTTAS